MADVQRSSMPCRSLAALVLLGGLVAGCAEPSATPSPPSMSTSSYDSSATTGTTQGSTSDTTGPTESSPPGTTGDPTDSGPTDSAGSSGPTTSTGTSSPPPEIPAAATKKTEAGAKAFARFYIELINYSAQSGDGGPMVRAASPDCKLCIRYGNAVTERTRRGGWQRGGDIRVEALTRIAAVPVTNAAFFMSVRAESGRIRATDSAEVQLYPAEKYNIDLQLVWRQARWFVSRMETS